MKNIIYKILLTIGVAVMIVGCLSSCLTTQKAKDYLKEKDKLAEICAETYPVKTEYIKGDSVTVLDTLYVGENLFDTLYYTIKDTVTRVITKTLPAKIITKTIHVTDTIVKENTARIEDFNIQLRNKDIENGILKADRDNWKSKAKKRLWWFLIAVGAIGAYTILKIKKIISF